MAVSKSFSSTSKKLAREANREGPGGKTSRPLVFTAVKHLRLFLFSYFERNHSRQYKIAAEG